jgi:hypothetical protein
MLCRASSDRRALAPHRGHHKVGDAEPGRARAEEYKALTGQRFMRALSAA